MGYTCLVLKQSISSQNRKGKSGGSEISFQLLPSMQFMENLKLNYKAGLAQTILYSCYTYGIQKTRHDAWLRQYSVIARSFNYPRWVLFLLISIIQRTELNGSLGMHLFNLYILITSDKLVETEQSAPWSFQV